MPGPKTRSTRKNTAPKGVKPVGQPTYPTYPTWSPPYGIGGTGLHYSPSWDTPSYPGYTPPINLGSEYGYLQVPGTATLAPTLPPLPNYGPEYNPTYGSGNKKGNQAQEQTQVPQWNPYAPVFQWGRDAQGNFIPELAGVREGVPEEAAQGVDPDWSSSYHPLYYSEGPGRFKQQPLTAVWGGTNKGTMGTRGWRRPKSSYLPEQQVKMDSEGNVWAERPEWDRRTRWDKYLEEINAKHAGNNNMKTIIGSPVSWRT